MKKVLIITNQQRLKLEEGYKNGKTKRIRRRCHLIILSHKGKTVKELCDIFEIHSDTVYTTINNFNKFGTKYINDKPRSGRPTALTDEEEEFVLKEIAKDSRNLKKILFNLKNRFNKIICKVTLIRFLKKKKFIWKRYRKSLKKKRNNLDFSLFKNILNALFKCEEEGLLDLYFFDEVSFNLVPSVPYGWIKINEQQELPSSKSQNINVLGFLNTANDLHSYTCKGSVNSDVVIACFDDFAKNIKKQTVVIIDNAPTHTSKKFISKIEEWASKGLYIRNLPAYSPELNIIEILWRFIKYQWISLDAYQSLSNLEKELEIILNNVGKKYVINFSKRFK
jgi:transposase